MRGRLGQFKDWGYGDLGSLDTQARFVLHYPPRSRFLSVSVRNPEVLAALNTKRAITCSVGLHYCAIRNIYVGGRKCTIKKSDKYMYIAKEKGKNEVFACVTGKGG